MAARNAIGYVDNNQVTDGSKDSERPREKFNSNLVGGRKGIAMMTKIHIRSNREAGRRRDMARGQKNAFVVNDKKKVFKRKLSENSFLTTFVFSVFKLLEKKNK